MDDNHTVATNWPVPNALVNLPIQVSPALKVVLDVIVINVIEVTASIIFFTVGVEPILVDISDGP